MAPLSQGAPARARAPPTLPRIMRPEAGRLPGPVAVPAPGNILTPACVLYHALDEQGPRPGRRTMTRVPMTAILGVALAIAVTTTMDATGLTVFSALPLMPLMLIFWRLDRLGRGEIGFRPGGLRFHVLACVHPIAVMGALAGLATLGGALDVANTDWARTGRDLALVSLTTLPAVILTEEGFFRGWLWGSLARTARGEATVLLGSSLAFTAWHISPVVLPTGFDLPPPRVPVYLVNVFLLGLIWGIMRRSSGSILVASVSHALWNGMAYVLFGFGTRTGALGIERTDWYGPEVGILGIALNLVFAAAILAAGRRGESQRLDGKGETT